MSYTPGKDLLVTWAINNGDVGEHPTGTPSCTAPPTDPPRDDHHDDHDEPTTTTTTLHRPADDDRRRQAHDAGAGPLRGEADPAVDQAPDRSLKLDIPGVQLVGTYPIDGATDDDVVQVLYTKATVQASLR